MSSSTRIRYQKTSEPGILVSTKQFQHPTNGARYQVSLDEANQKFTISEVMSNTVVAEGRAVNNHQVRINGKKKLEELGISFGEEQRTVKTKAVA